MQKTDRWELFLNSYFVRVLTWSIFSNYGFFASLICFIRNISPLKFCCTFQALFSRIPIILLELHSSLHFLSANLIYLLKRIFHMFRKNDIVASFSASTRLLSFHQWRIGLPRMWRNQSPFYKNTRHRKCCCLALSIARSYFSVQHICLASQVSQSRTKINFLSELYWAPHFLANFCPILIG